MTDHSNSQARMPVLFVGHGSPMNAIEDNPFSQEWRRLGETLPRPKAILCISAHWETRGVGVTAMPHPRTIHDFGGFPRELFAAQYPAPGNPELAAQVQSVIQTEPVILDDAWGLDHGCWSVLKPMFPAADIPVVQLSLDTRQPGSWHYSLGKELLSLRDQGILILASGNIVHNLGRVRLNFDDPRGFNVPFAFDWATEASDLFKKLIMEDRHAELADYLSLGSAVRMAVPTPEHYLPLLYALALKQADETVTLFNDQAVAGSLTMTSLLIQ